MNNDRERIHVVFGLPGLLFGGGIEKQLVKQLQLFDRSRFKITLITLFDYKERKTLFDAVPADVTSYRLNFRGMGDVKSWRELYHLLKKVKPDIVVSSMFSANTAFRLLKPLCGYTCIPREHNIYHEKALYQRVIDHVLSYFSERIVAVSQSVADFASRHAWIPRSKFTVIHNGVDYSAIQEFLAHSHNEIIRIRKELRLQEGQRIILHVARLKPQKNQILLLDAFKQFTQNEKHNEYVLVIAGDGIERERLENYTIELGLSNTVFFLGYRSDVYSLYAASDFFVLTSRHEGFPNVGIEAMAFGVPLISTEVPGVDEFIRDGYNGYIVESAPDDVCEKMQILAELSPEKREQYRINCFVTAKEFDITQTVSAYEKLFTDIYYHHSL